MQISSLFWKIPVVLVVSLLAVFSANQVGWTGSELILNSPPVDIISEKYLNCTPMSYLGELGDALIVIAFGGIAIFSVAVAYRLAKPILLLVVPVMLYFFLIMGAWEGVASNWDVIRANAIKYHKANMYALQHMTQKGRLLSCNDSRITIEADALNYCQSLLNTSQGK